MSEHLREDRSTQAPIKDVSPGETGGFLLQSAGVSKSPRDRGGGWEMKIGF